MNISKDFLLGIIFGILLLYFSKDILNIFKTSEEKRINHIIKLLIRSSARWATAAKQDKSIMIRVLHANYATGYLWALHEWATPEEIKKVTGVDYDTFKKEILKVQDASTKEMIRICPKYAPENDYLIRLGKM